MLHICHSFQLLIHYMIRIPPQQYAITPLHTTSASTHCGEYKLTTIYSSLLMLNTSSTVKDSSPLPDAASVLPSILSYLFLIHQLLSIWTRKSSWLLIIRKSRRKRRVRCHQWQRQHGYIHTWTDPNRTTNGALDYRMVKWM